MPIVNGKHYPYTKAGKKAAGQAMMKGKAHGTTMKIPQMTKMMKGSKMKKGM